MRYCFRWKLSVGSVSECLAPYRKGISGAGVPGFGDGGVSITRGFENDNWDARESAEFFPARTAAV